MSQTLVKFILCAKYLYEAEYQLLINRRESAGLKCLNGPKAFIEYSNDMDDIYKNIEEYNPNKKRKILILFDDMIADMLSSKKLNSIIIELFIRDIKLNISLVFITQSYFAVPKDVRLNCMHYHIMKIQNKREFAFNHLSGIDFQDFMNLYKKLKSKPYSFLVIDTTLPSDNSLCFRKNLLETIENLIMTIDNEIRDEKLQYQLYRQVKLMNMSSLQAKKSYHLIKVE